MGNCFNQDESQYSSLKTMKKVESVLNQPIHENESGKICLKDFLVKQAGFEGENEMQLKRICYESYKKADIIKYGLINHTMLEKNVLEYSNNPFVIKLQYSFQIEQKLYLVMELVNGGELLRVITKQPQKHFSFNQTQFCAAQVVLGLEYIHEKLKVIQRVQNQKIFQQQNFGLSKQYESLDMKFFTIVGTPEYLAPEILNNSGHNQTVDWWCLGILIYEKLITKIIFQNTEKQIKEGHIQFPDNMNEQSKDIITQFLNKDPIKRLGHKSIQEIKQHNFFKEINWEDLSNFRVQSPILEGVQKLQLQIAKEVPIAKKILETPQVNQNTQNFEKFSSNHDKF